MNEMLQLPIIAKKLTELKSLRSDVILFRREIDREIESEEKRRDAIKLRNKNNRLHIALKMRLEGKTFEEVGAMLGVGAARARDMAAFALRRQEMTARINARSGAK